MRSFVCNTSLLARKTGRGEGEEAGGMEWVLSGTAAAATTAKMCTYREMLLVRMNDQYASFPEKSVAWIVITSC